jgi:signal transduction histidine kinase
MRDLLLVAASALTAGIIVYLLVRPKPRPVSRVPEQPAPAPSASVGADEVLERMAEGALVLDEGVRPIFANRAARTLLGFRDVGLPDRVPSEEVAALARRASSEGESEQEIAVRFPLPMTLRVRAIPLHAAGVVFVSLQDITQEALAQRVRTEFVAHASHELKSPVASLQTVAEALTSAIDDDPEAARQFSERMVRETDRLGQLVRDLLDLSRLEEAVAPPSEFVDLAEAARRGLEQITPMAESKQIKVTTSIASEVPVLGDDEQLCLMIRNLLENAIRYSPEGGEVWLEVLGDASEATVSVADNGIGIPREAHGRVFERFYRVDRGRTRERGGTGLGLAIVKHVAELHGGWVGLQSELGEGSTFVAHLPAVETDEESLERVAG